MIEDQVSVADFSTSVTPTPVVSLPPQMRVWVWMALFVWVLPRYFNAVQNLVASIQRSDYAIVTVVYDLGLTAEHLADVK